MRSPTFTNSLGSLAILMSTLTLAHPTVHAIPTPDLLGLDDDPTLNATALQILTPPEPLTVLPPDDTITITSNSSTMSTLSIATTGPWIAGCIQVDNIGTGSPASSKHIREGIKYLRGVPGQPQITHYGCSQVSCSYKSAIFWCNEELGWGLRLNSFADIADGAQAIMDRCGKGKDVMGKSTTGWAPDQQKGQQWSVVVTGGDC
ncbi:hypothetical protein NEUTE1DRAFT_83301 [Neurospora tetrasperma FGSC 2508]|uniref:Ecp2 effector protein domain-containing protein n=1 Tax=Neurospora tetrasperma (strain FGSC 2508 / ATCC MYA-4615 / P0657) TaxID=510951 RepID=F8MP13_NEUT8|nr:uncharacterized protein NEUTE1DRAFT_83301 [Neurospora tetrasperma FGSC 2508]EGO56232.1 hypothetical protein NEUTE1DRAFT_83301 [Neurospora tetrasperma FGSC 2508]EGZ70915.1 hypothetical protein NEUTE2DRAFT_114110 [Neurospora tetrasperma FGSC 2509]